MLRHLPVNVPEGICYGQTDVPLKMPYQAALLKIQQQLPQIAGCFSSPLSRCTKMAQFLAPNYQPDHRLMEMNFGKWEMQSWDTIFQQPFGKKWMNNYTTLSTPEGESFTDLWQRALKFLQSLHSHPHTNLLIITHAGMVRALCGIIDKRPIDKAFDLKVPYGSIHCRRLTL